MFIRAGALSRASKLVSGLLPVLFFLPPAVAAEDGESALDTVLVTATRSEVTLSQIPESATVVGSDQIRQTPAKSLDDVLRTVASVNLPIAASYQLHPTADSVSMRGLGGSRALVLLDGVPLNDPFFGYVQWNQVPLEDVQRVEIVRGGGATLWGNYAMGGVINIITRVPDKEEFSVEGGGGGFGTYRADGHVALPLDDRFRTALDAAVNGTQGYQAVDASIRAPLDIPTSFRARNVQMTNQFELEPSLRAEIRASYHDNHQTLYTPLSTNAQRDWMFSGDLAKTFGTSTVTATVYRTDSHFRTDNTDTPQGATPGTAEFVQNRHWTPVTATGASLLWTLKSATWLRELSAGADYQQIQGSDYADILSDTGTQIRTDIGRGSQRLTGTFVQADVQPVEPLAILLSGRYQHFRNYDGFDGSPGGLGAVPDTSSSSFDPRVSVRYSLAPEFALRAAGYKAFRAPTLDNLYRAFSTPYGIFYGNPVLKPERLTGGEAGFDVTLTALRAQVTYYYNTIDDLLTSRNLDASELPPGFFYGSRNINAGSARAEGLETEIDWRVTEHLHAIINYAYADSVIRDNPLDPASIGHQLGGVPRQTAAVSLAYSASRVRLASRMRWVQKSYADNDHTLPVDAHFLVDLSASYALTGALEPFVEIENLLDRHYVADNSGFSAPQLGTPLTVFAGLRATFR